jgi:hypothetical protein
MSGRIPGSFKHSHIRPAILVELLAQKPELRTLFPIADAFDMAARWNA